LSAFNDFPIDWRITEEGLAPFYEANPGEWREAAWAPQPGSQVGFLSAGAIFEVLYEGTRGGGKTDCLIMDFLQYVGRGWGPEWRGILFRQTYKQLSDVVVKTKKWFKKTHPGAVFNEQDYRWTFPSGEVLYLRYMDKEDDYWNYHGHAYPWIGWEELSNWSSDKCYKVMMSCCRSTKVGMPRCYRATCNPYGPGHNWIKSRFQLPHMRGKVLYGAMGEPPRVAIFSQLSENKVLLHADPKYIDRIRAAARNPSELAAWIDGSWDITAGGMVDDIFQSSIHVVPSFPMHLTPKRWKMDRTFDWGSSKPFAACWWLESNGEPFEYQNRIYGKVPGDLYLCQEWYGWNGARNEGVRALATDVAEGIRDRQKDWGVDKRVRPGPADSSIYDKENGNCIATDMAKKGVLWVPVIKGPGSRKQGWEQVRKYLSGSVPLGGGPREVPGMFIMDCCTQTLETFPSIPRSHKDLDDVDTESEDHLADAIRYRIYKKETGARQGSMWSKH
jgi:hypothetical protein